MVRKLLSSTFGNVVYDSGAVEPAVTFPTNEDVTRQGPMMVDKHDDRFYLNANGVVTANGGIFMTYAKHDLRDLLEEGECLSDVAIGVQRMRENVAPIAVYNMPPSGGNIVEMLLITNSKIDTNDGQLDGSLISLLKAGFQPIATGVNRNKNKLDDMREIVYCERRIYAQDTSQVATSPFEMGALGGTGGPPNPPDPPSRWVNNFLLVDRTVTGEADLIVGPDITIIRLFQIIGRDRGVQNQFIFPGEAAGEYLYNWMRIYVEFPPLKVSMIGDKRKLTDTEKAIEYTNVLLSNQNLIQR